MMSTAERARELAEQWHCRYCADNEEHEAVNCWVDVPAIATEIAALLDLLVEAQDRVEHLLAGHPHCNCESGALIEKIDKALGEGK